MRFDFRDRLGLAWDDAGDAYTFAEAIDLVIGLANTPGTQLHASVAGWQWPATWGELAQIALVERVQNYLRDKDDPPIKWPRPWPDREAATPEEMARAEALLARYGGIRDD